MREFIVVVHRDVIKLEISLLKEANLYMAYLEIIAGLKENSYQLTNHWELLSPKKLFNAS
ncbi:hypothetical protein ATW69_09635 [Oenococcus oeni]|uniref:hypothetical protein n=1 Tax=Oenococcus oeni TaxID=1247 RepID=UPI0008F89691|nr:hypothetical protein [Oenococcus oeni]OIL68702.1 hypothetical protein ATX30_07430 [Oenococcus oeni]OIM47685.1 hypothetical protein ATX76_07450 [Oenococcus oeni]OLQ32732.1 hypothetical protein ATW69_09635 [Oenococcus oeni]